MYCNCMNSRCNNCKSFVTSNAITISGESLVVNIPTNNYPNNAEICLVLTQALPAGSDSLPVLIQIGEGGPTYPLRTMAGHNVYADQLTTRRIYNLRVAADSGTFVYNGRCSLPCSSAVVPGSLPVAAAE